MTIMAEQNLSNTGIVRELNLYRHLGSLNIDRHIYIKHT